MMNVETSLRTQFIGYGKHVLVIDSDKNTRRLLAGSLQADDFQVHCVTNAAEAFAYLDDGAIPNLIIMDIHQTDMDGSSLGKTISQQYEIPIIVVSRIADVDVIVQAIGDFADDYVTKPFDEAELLARVHRVLLRVGIPYQGSLSSRQRVADDLYVDFGLGHAYLSGERNVLTPIEGQILHILYRERGQIVPYETLTSEIWQEVDDERLNTLWVHVRRLRTKIEANPRKPKHLLTVRGNGYYLAQ